MGTDMVIGAGEMAWWRGCGRDSVATYSNHGRRLDQGGVKPYGDIYGGLPVSDKKRKGVLDPHDFY